MIFMKKNRKFLYYCITMKGSNINFFADRIECSINSLNKENYLSFSGNNFIFFNSNINLIEQIDLVFENDIDNNNDEFIPISFF